MPATGARNSLWSCVGLLLRTASRCAVVLRSTVTLRGGTEVLLEVEDACGQGSRANARWKRAMLVAARPHRAGAATGAARKARTVCMAAIEPLSRGAGGASAKSCADGSDRRAAPAGRWAGVVRTRAQPGRTRGRERDQEGPFIRSS